MTLAAPSTLIKNCSTVLPEVGEQTSQKLDIRIIRKSDGTSVAFVRPEGKSRYEDEVLIEEHKIRAGLTQDSDPDSLNSGESLIVHAMALEGDPEFQGAFQTGVELQRVRQVKVYQIGKKTRFGSTSIVEARDQQGTDLGSFLGGFLVSACK